MCLACQLLCGADDEWLMLADRRACSLLGEWMGKIWHLGIHKIHECTQSKHLHSYMRVRGVTDVRVRMEILLVLSIFIFISAHHGHTPSRVHMQFHNDPPPLTRAKTGSKQHIQ